MNLYYQITHINYGGYVWAGLVDPLAKELWRIMFSSVNPALATPAATNLYRFKTTNEDLYIAYKDWAVIQSLVMQQVSSYAIEIYVQ